MLLHIFLLLLDPQTGCRRVRKCPENAKNRKEIKWLLIAPSKIFRVWRAFLFLEIFGKFFFLLLQDKINFQNIELVFFSEGGVAPKNGPKVKKVGPNTKKTTLKLE